MALILSEFAKFSLDLLPSEIRVPNCYLLMYFCFAIGMNIDGKGLNFNPVTFLCGFQLKNGQFKILLKCAIDPGFIQNWAQFAWT